MVKVFIFNAERMSLSFFFGACKNFRGEFLASSKYFSENMSPCARNISKFVGGKKIALKYLGLFV